MCVRHKVSRFCRLVVALGPFLAFAPESFAQENPVWKRIAGTSVNVGLASPASGPVESLWYAAGKGTLLARTASGRVFETSDFSQWKLNSSPVPATGARSAMGPARWYVLGTDSVIASDDSGRSWMNLTAYNGRSVIGGGFTALAVSPGNPLEIAVSNRFGVWRSLDGGLTWRGMNESLPNFAARRLSGRHSVLLADGSMATAEGGAWVLSKDADPESELAARLGVASAVRSGRLIYAGTSDGRLRTSRDGGSSWVEALPVAGIRRIDRLWVDEDRPETALAAAGPRLLRTVNGGLFWDDVTGPLPAAEIRGVAADRDAGIVYVATERGVFFAAFSLNDAGPGAVRWDSAGTELPAAPAWDVRLNADNTLTVALDGYGVYETAVPHKTRRVRVVNAADMSERPAAPGSLITVLGAKVTGARGGGLLYPVLAANERASQLQVPFDAVAGTFPLALDLAGTRFAAPLAVRDASPAIFVDSDGVPLILDAASGLILDPNTAVRAGSVLQLMATGLGKVSPEWPSGLAAPVENPPVVKAEVTAFLDGSPVKVIRATLAPGYVGYYVVELEVPAIVNRGASELRLVVGNEESNRVRVFLEPDQALR